MLVPCHRVIGKNNALTGYKFGIEKKEYLLDLEQNHKSSVNI
ncbi:MAG: MGMT family protein [Finegoldia magna]